MPIVANTQLSAVRKANIVMAHAFFPRAKEWLYPRFCGSYTTTNLVEPLVIGSAAPQMKRWNGTVNSTGLPSFSMNVTNPLWKNLLNLDRTELEADQTNTLIKKVEEMGIVVADLPDQIFVKRLLNGANAGSQTEVFNGQSYTVTFDGQPLFSASHNTGNGTSQSNIVQGTHPNTAALIFGQDVATTVNELQLAVYNVISKLKTVVNNQGMPIFQTLDTKKSVVIIVPPCLEGPAYLAFKAVNSLIGGSPSGSTGSTTNIAPMFVKDVVTSGLLAGFPDPEGTGSIAPVNETDFYVLITDDRVKPFYVQLFKPATKNDLFPQDYDVDAAINALLDESKNLSLKYTKDEATLFASTIVEHNLNAQGSMAQRDVVENESFFVSGRFRGNIAYGPWFCSWRVKPTGGS